MNKIYKYKVILFLKLLIKLNKIFKEIDFIKYKFKKLKNKNNTIRNLFLGLIRL